MSKCGNIDDDDNIITKRFPENYKKKPAKMSVSLFVLIGQWFSFGGGRHFGIEPNSAVLS